jgi:hypothetical protein
LFYFVLSRSFESRLEATQLPLSNQSSFLTASAAMGSTPHYRFRIFPTAAKVRGQKTDIPLRFPISDLCPPTCSVIETLTRQSERLGLLKTPASAILTVMRMKLFCLCAAVTGLITAGVRAGALDDLSNRKDLTPENLIRSCADFTFELGDRPQDSETFLQRKRGDCDDFAQMASTVLARHGYKTKMVVVMMDGATHVVCYVDEIHGVLDYNHRKDANPIVPSDGSLENIAQNVAKYFRLNWRMASEFRYDEKQRPVYLDTAFPQIAAAPKKPVISVAQGEPVQATR